MKSLHVKTYCLTKPQIY